MSPFRQSRSPRISARSRRKSSWSVGPQQAGLPSITASSVTLWAIGAQALEDGLTVVRIRGSLGCWLEVVTAIGDGFVQVAFGICVVSENAFDAGAASVPGPLTDKKWDGWMWHRFVDPMLGFSVTEGDNTGPISQVKLEVDTKAMRKTKESDVVIGVTEVATEIGTATLQFIASTRMLSKLP